MINPFHHLRKIKTGLLPLNTVIGIKMIQLTFNFIGNIHWARVIVALQLWCVMKSLEKSTLSGFITEENSKLIKRLQFT